MKRLLSIFFTILISANCSTFSKVSNVEGLSNLEAFINSNPRGILLFKKDVKNIDKLTDFFKKASDYPEIKISDVKFAIVKLSSKDLDSFAKRFQVSKEIIGLNMFQNGKILKTDKSLATLSNLKDKNQIILMIKQNWQDFIDSVLENKYPIKSEILKNELKIAKIKAFLDTISFAEGTMEPNGYKKLYTGLYFNGYKDHPRLINCGMIKGKQICSSAAGKYQILSRTWDRVAKKISAANFSPSNQDLAALALIAQAGAIEDIKNGNFETAIEKTSCIWASFPSSPYGQQRACITMQRLKKFYNDRLALLEQSKMR